MLRWKRRAALVFFKQEYTVIRSRNSWDQLDQEPHCHQCCMMLGVVLGFECHTRALHSSVNDTIVLADTFRNFFIPADTVKNGRYYHYRYFKIHLFITNIILKKLKILIHSMDKTL